MCDGSILQQEKDLSIELLRIKAGNTLVRYGVWVESSWVSTIAKSRSLREARNRLGAYEMCNDFLCQLPEEDEKLNSIIQICVEAQNQYEVAYNFALAMVDAIAFWDYDSNNRPGSGWPRNRSGLLISSMRVYACAQSEFKDFMSQKFASKRLNCQTDLGVFQTAVSADPNEPTAVQQMCSWIDAMHPFQHGTREIL